MHVGLHGLFETEALTPDGKPDTDRVTPSVAPATCVLVIVFWVNTFPELLFVAEEVPELESE